MQPAPHTAAPGAGDDGVLLHVEGLVKRFGGLVAVDGVTFNAARDQVLGVIGVNGSGKTTMMNCVSGLYKPDGGSVAFKGHEVTGRPPHDITRLGIGRTFQVPRTFRRMTLVENLLVPVLHTDAGDALLEERACNLLDDMDMYELRHHTAEELSGGQQKLLELARVMMLNPDLILLDEPFAGVNPSLCRKMIETIQRLQGQGLTFVLVSHDLTSIYRLSQHIVVFNEGRNIAEGSVDEIRNDPDVIEAYLGSPT